MLFVFVNPELSLIQGFSDRGSNSHVLSSEEVFSFQADLYGRITPTVSEAPLLNMAAAMNDPMPLF